jgi:RNA polymerase sigma-70 factor (ECF subfamily)
MNASILETNAAVPRSKALDATERDEILARLIGQIIHKNQPALAELYDRTSSRVCGLTLRMVRERCAAEDITQEVYLHVWQKAETFDPARGSVLRWLATITRSRCLDRLRASNARARREHDGAPIHALCDRAPDPERASSDSERVRHIQHLLQQLPADEHRAIKLAFFDEFTHAEIATRTNLPLGTIKTRIRRGLSQLREQLTFAGKCSSPLQR